MIYSQSKLVIKNISNPPQNVSVANYGSLKPGQVADIFSMCKDITDAAVIQWFRKPNGFLYKEVEVRKNIEIIEISLGLYDAVSVSPAHIDSLNEPSSKKVLAVGESGKFEWVDQHDITDLLDVVNKALKVSSPLIRTNGMLILPRANEHTNGYLSKEDWLFFRGKANGIRVWQYQDFDRITEAKVKLTKFENGESIVFNPDFIVHNSAVIVTRDSESKPRAETPFWVRKKEVSVDNHLGDTVILNDLPKPGTKCRVWYLITMPEHIEIPKDYTPPPRIVREQRIEVIDDVDVGNSTRSTIRGDKLFGNNVSVKGSVSVDEKLDVNGPIKGDLIQLTANPNVGYVLQSDAVGNASWAPNPLVESAPPKQFYNGQLWMKVPEYELFVYDGTRKKWISVRTFSVVGAKNSTHCSNVYVDTFDNIPMDFNTAVLPFDATLVALTASCESESSWSAEVHKNNALVQGSVVNIISNDRVYSDTLNVDFNEGDKIQLFVSGHGISMPRIEAIFKRRA